jgi:hypothetical protein
MRAPVGWDGCVILILGMACNPADLLEPSVDTCALERRWFWPAVAGRLSRWNCSVTRTHSHRQAHWAGQLTKATASLWLAAGTAERQRHLAAFDFFLFFISCVCVLPMCRLLRGCLSISSLHLSRISSARIGPYSRISCCSIPIGWLRLPETFRWDSHLSLWKHSSMPYSSVRVTWSPDHEYQLYKFN